MEVDGKEIHVASELAEEAQDEEGQRGDCALLQDALRDRSIVACDELDADERNKADLFSMSDLSYLPDDTLLTPNTIKSKMTRGSNHA